MEWVGDRLVARIAELERQKMNLTLKLLFIEEWFDNILPNDWDMGMKRWEDR